MKKRIITLLLAGVCAFALCACGTKEETVSTEETEQTTDVEQSEDTEETEDVQQTGMANPVVESTQQGVIDKTGIDLPAPKDAADVKYSYIEVPNGDPIAQVSFTIGGGNFCLRAKSTGVTSLYPEGAKAEEVDLGEEDISGFYYEWKTVELCEVQGRQAIHFIADDGENGHIIWLDAVPGFIYDLSTTDSAQSLKTMAEDIFVPMQGDAE